jgi:CRISPR-associated protein Cmr6
MPFTIYSMLQSLHQPDLTTHAGLWLDKFLQDSGEEARKTLVKQVAEKIGPPYLYIRFYTRWKKALDDIGAQSRRARVMGRLAINLGAEGVLETSIALHHTYGTPFIPGSALKGLASHYADHRLGGRWKKDQPDYITMFGDLKTAGYVTFFDALYIPGTGPDMPGLKNKPLWQDVITVHHPEYYQTGKTPPADWDSPTPVPFLTATGEFLIALAGRQEWVKAAFDILALALEEEGIGAKTSSGYGRMQFVSEDKMFPGVPFAQRKRQLLQGTPPFGRHRGTVVDVRADGRFGRVNPARGGEQIRIHISQMREPGSSLKDGQVVEYRLGQYQGHAQAEDVVVLLEPEEI